MRNPESEFEGIAEQYRIELIILFGSRARDRFRPDSDMDVALLRRCGAPRWTLDDLCELEYRLWKILRPHGEIDLVDVADASPLLLGQIAACGRPLYNASVVSFPAFRSWAMRRYEDGAKWFQRRSDHLMRTLDVA